MTKAQEGAASAPAAPSDLQVIAAVIMADLFLISNDPDLAKRTLASVGIERGHDPRLALTVAHVLQARGVLLPTLELPKLITQMGSPDFSEDES